MENIDKLLEKMIGIKSMLDEINSEIMKEIEEIKEIKRQGYITANDYRLLT